MSSTPNIFPYVTTPSRLIKTFPVTILEKFSCPRLSEIKSKSSLSSLKNDSESEKIFTSGSKDLEKFKLYCSKPEKTERIVKKEK